MVHEFLVVFLDPWLPQFALHSAGPIAELYVPGGQGRLPCSPEKPADIESRAS